MINVVTKAAGLSLLALAALPVVALTAAHAAPATVKISDLDLSRPAHMATFERRVDQAADKLCAGYTVRQNLSAAAACRDSVRQEALDQLNGAQRQAVSGSITVASR